MTNVISVGANVEPLDSEADAAEDTEATEETDGSSDTQSESKTDNPKPDEAKTETEATTQATEAAKPVVADGAPKYYTVRDGDTLSSISFQMYHSILYVDNIMEANGMKNGDEIYVGQQILIPSIP